MALRNRRVVRRQRARPNLPGRGGAARTGNDAQPPDDQSNASEDGDFIKSPDELRRDLLSNIENELQKGNHATSTQDLLSLYKDSEELKNCLVEPNGDYRTILHWIVMQVAFSGDNKHDAKRGMKAAKILVQLAMKCDETLIEMHDKQQETALMKAISSEKPKIAELAWCMFQYGKDTPSFRKAIAKTNRKGENCLHIAIIRNNFPIAKELIQIAENHVFRQRRNPEQDGSPLPGGRNTPLHDAVEYGRGVFEAAYCLNPDDQGGQCDNCQLLMTKFDEKSASATELVKSLVERCDQALKDKNANDESPYRYHLRTKKEYPKINNTPGSSSDSRYSLRRPGDGSMPPPATSNPLPYRPVTNSNPNARLHKQFCHKRPRDDAAKWMRRYLKEAAFTVGGFEDACGCFFGDEPDEDGRSQPFRPGHAIIPAAVDLYKMLVPYGTSILSHVDLKMDDDTTTTAGAVQTEETEATLESRDKASNEISSWNRRMKAVDEVFNMLRGQGVKTILKVTVKDNKHRPCSDKKIQECLKDFDVRYLDWNKRDLCIDIVHAACPNISELTLYWSGRGAVLIGWTASTGLCGLNKLSKVNINAYMGLEKHQDFLTSVESFRTEMIQTMFLMRWALNTAHARKIARADEQYWRLDLNQLKKEGEDTKQQTNEISSEGKQEGEGAASQNSDREVEEYRTDLEKCETNLAEARNRRRKLDLKVLRIAKTKQRLDDERRAKLFSDDDGKAPLTEGRGSGDTKRPTRENSTQSGKAEPGLSDTGLDADDSYDSATPSEDFADKDDEVFTKSPNSSSEKLFAVDADVIMDDDTDHDDDDDEQHKTYVTWGFKVEKGFLEGFPAGSDDGNADGPTSMSTRGTGSADSHRWLKAVRDFIKKAEELADTEDGNKNLIKVALLDDGVDIAQFQTRGGKLGSPGWPSVPPHSSENLWNCSERGHGTTMARLIQMVCPRVELFVAKLGGVDDVTKPDTAARAAEAVKWAMEKEVDIISMSWSLLKSADNDKGIEKLKTMVERAAGKNIIMYCAAADTLGPYAVPDIKLYPHSADTEHIRIVGSSQEDGEKSKFVDETQVDYLFPGEDIPELNGQRGGSSAATAVATGFAALLLWCFGTTISGGVHRDMADPGRMHDVFESLKTIDGKKWVNVTKVLKTEHTASNTVRKVVEYCKSVGVVGPRRTPKR
ncbi:hypothetical protein B0H63DRAFT_533929 [Podospora didyma]|uniref:Peptidase S8/S53 domain-containing protein n=1 Tax=Podospora didyma TaxID=330526 RepID=A0AAE0P8D1_9PEZI|nr:hypothetical protein B0H63DRAFT_533929 [Podospora didyma]